MDIYDLLDRIFDGFIVVLCVVVFALSIYNIQLFSWLVHEVFANPNTSAEVFFNEYIRQIFTVLGILLFQLVFELSFSHYIEWTFQCDRRNPIRSIARDYMLYLLLSPIVGGFVGIVSNVITAC